MLRHRFDWKRVPLAGALAYESDGSCTHLFFELRLGTNSDESLIEFLGDRNHSEQRLALLNYDRR